MVVCRCGPDDGQFCGSGSGRPDPLGRETEAKREPWLAPSPEGNSPGSLGTECGAGGERFFRWKTYISSRKSDSGTSLYKLHEKTWYSFSQCIYKLSNLLPITCSNRVEAWTRDVDFLLHQEGRPMVNLIPDKTKARIMEEDWQNTDKATSWLRKEAINITQPFVLYLGLNLPHPYPSPYTGENFGSSTFQTSPYWLKKVFYEAIKIPKWSPLSEMHPVDYYSSYTKNCTGQFTKKEIRDIRAFYYAMCAETDAMLGEIILTLYQLNLLQKTVVIFTSDHGELAMDHRQFYKMSMYEASSHVPLLIMGPGIKANLHVPDLVSLVDIYPTLLDIAGVPLHQNLSGYSLVPLSSEASSNNSKSTRPHPSWILSEFHGCNVNASTYMLRIDKWKYIAYSDGASSPPQLFDLSSDPDELTNIATRFPEITHSLDQKLRSIINYPVVSASVHQYNKKQFISWKDSLGQNYTKVIANLRWHQDWLKEPIKYESAINQWLKTNTNL
ncbi:arylsulfatase K isoform X3 [Petaurus breviceps papuanus]|uniref:arylsulfatase K isoform X3 n=1 Tax=Petaurus breviceps papuanus TaxID=3040969 RepID=UPI0036D9FABC